MSDKSTAKFYIWLLEVSDHNDPWEQKLTSEEHMRVVCAFDFPTDISSPCQPTPSMWRPSRTFIFTALHACITHLTSLHRCIPWRTWWIKQKTPQPENETMSYLFIVILMLKCILQLWGIRYYSKLHLAHGWKQNETQLLPTAQSVWCSTVSPGDDKIYTSEGSACAFMWEAAGKKSSLSR